MLPSGQRLRICHPVCDNSVFDILWQPFNEPAHMLLSTATVKVAQAHLELLIVTGVCSKRCKCILVTCEFVKFTHLLQVTGWIPKIKVHGLSEFRPRQGIRHLCVLLSTISFLCFHCSILQISCGQVSPKLVWHLKRCNHIDEVIFPVSMGLTIHLKRV